MGTQGKENLSVDGKTGETPAPAPGSAADAAAQITRRARRNISAVKQTSFGRRLLNVLRNLAWVVPLTLLVWLFAEREQIPRDPERMSVPLVLTSERPDHVVSLPNPSDRTVSFDVRGTSYMMSEARNALGKRGLELVVPSDAVPGKSISVPVIDILSNDRAFRERGLSMSNCSNFSPSTVTVSVDELVRGREFRPKAPPGLEGVLEGDVIFEPPTVKLSGPRSELDNAERVQPIAEITPQMLPKGSGLQDIQPVPLRLAVPNDHITISPSVVKAKVRVHSVDRYVHPSVPVLTMGPQALLDKYSVVYPQGQFMPRVTFIGPADQVNRIRSGQFTPKAYLEVTRDDIQQSLPRAPTYILPPDVKVSDQDPDDKDRTIDFHLDERSHLQ
jgi:hypothetical protein